MRYLCIFSVFLLFAGCSTVTGKLKRIDNGYEFETVKGVYAELEDKNKGITLKLDTKHAPNRLWIIEFFLRLAGSAGNVKDKIIENEAIE